MALFATGAQATTTTQTRAADGAYGWPVKPFHRQHPIRGYFGDPRTVFLGAPTFRSLMSGQGSFSFHFGVDICAADGTPVYAVRSGTAAVLGGTTIQVSSGGGFATQYWHVVPSVRDGQNVVAYQTVIGHVLKAAHHVHFTELDNGRPVNPLAPGHLGPYVDQTRPEISSITFRKSPAGRDLAPEFLRGRVHLIADAYDTPAMSVRAPARWSGLPVSPALLTWHIERAKDGVTVIREHTAFDVRTSLPAEQDFWKIYARGSHQNMLQIGTHRFWRQPGVYLYRLTRDAFDTRQLHNGIYTLVVTATDTRGNHSSTRQVFTVFN